MDGHSRASSLRRRGWGLLLGLAAGLGVVGALLLVVAMVAVSVHTARELDRTAEQLDQVSTERSTLAGELAHRTQVSQSLGTQVSSLHRRLDDVFMQLDDEQTQRSMLERALRQCRQPPSPPLARILSRRVSATEAFVGPPSSAGEPPEPPRPEKEQEQEPELQRAPGIVAASVLGPPPVAVITPRPPPPATIRPRKTSP